MNAVAEIVWIENTQPRLFHLPDRVEKILDPGGTGVTMGMKGIGTGRAVPPSVPKVAEGKKKTGVKPLLTAIDGDYWKFASANSQVKVWLRKGWLKVHDNDSPAVDHTPSLAPYNLKTALAVVAAEENMDLLGAWVIDEKRDEVAEALRARMVVVQRARNNAPASKPKG